MDFNKARVVGITTPIVEGCMTAEDLVAYAARVSNPSNQNAGTSPVGLIKYLIKHKHWSPFEMVSINVEVETTRAIARQLLRHRSFSFQEFSQRYADPTKDLSFVLSEARLQDTKNRQNSIATDDRELMNIWEEKQREVISKSIKAYDWGIANGLAKEVCRSVLPEGNVVSRLYVHGTLRSWIHYCELRCANGTQLEHMDLARKCWKGLSGYFPIVAEAVEIQT